MNLEIKNGRLIDPANGVDRIATLYIAEGQVAGIDMAPAGFTSQRTIDATGKLVIPGLVDLAARLREPGFEYRGTLESELCAALAGGHGFKRGFAPGLDDLIHHAQGKLANLLVTAVAIAFHIHY